MAPISMNPATPPSTRIATLLPSLVPSEQAVAQAVIEDMSEAVEMTADNLAAKVGTSRTTVIRTAKALGYEGYQQLRVALTRELASRPQKSFAPEEASQTGLIKQRFASFADSLSRACLLLDESSLNAAVDGCVHAKRVLVVANGLSGALAQTAVQRLTAIGRPAEYNPDATGQQIAASLLKPSDVCLAISGSGSTHATLAAATAAHKAGAHVITLTSFSASPLARIARTGLVIPTGDGSFRAELEYTSRAAFLLFIELFVDAVSAAAGDQSTEARKTVLAVLAESLED